MSRVLVLDQEMRSLMPCTPARARLLLKWDHQCAYCKQMGIPLQVEHIVPKMRGGSNRVTNLTLACEHCNHSKMPQPSIVSGGRSIND